MLLTITTTHEPATDLGFLLRKHPDRCQSFDTGTGVAHVLYPDAGTEQCTAAMILDIDPIGLVRGRRGGGNGDAAGLLTQYVNDRPYAASSFLTVAMSRVLGSAMAGRSEARPEISERVIPLTARVIPLRCRGGVELVERLFAPLGYAVKVQPVSGVEDRRAPYVDLTLAGTIRLADLLTHLYVLIPVLDNDKHYWVAEDEVDKLLRRGEGWLSKHPDRELITRRYLKHGRRLSRIAFDRLAELDDAPEENADPAAETNGLEPVTPLNELRYARVTEILAASGARNVLDLGCGSGKLLQRLFKVRQFEKIVGVDVASRDLELVRERLNLDRLPESQRDRVTLLLGALTYRDRRLTGFDAAAVVEVIEHMDLSRLEAFARVLFEAARPKTVVLTTPNAEYNAKYEALPIGAMRHTDHRFEWTRAEFEQWARRVAERFGYIVRFEGIGEADPVLGASTQMGIFTWN